MRYSLRIPIGVLGLAFALAVSVLLLGGNASRTYAHIADINGDTVTDSGDVHIEIDMDVTDGNPCNPVDTTRSVTSGTT